MFQGDYLRNPLLVEPLDQYVGDSAVDRETARRAGMHPVGAAWGFRPAEELWAGEAGAVLGHLTELLEVLDGRRPWMFF